MEWNPETRQYEDADGNPVDPAQVRDWIDGFITNSQGEIDQESSDLLSGAITVAAFFAFLGSLITSMHIASSLIAYGGEDEMNNARWGRVDERLSSELAYLEAFKEQVQEAEMVTRSFAKFIASSTSPRIAAEPEEELSKTANAIARAIRLSGRQNIVSTIDDALESVGEQAESVGAIVDSFGERIESIIWGEVESRASSYPNAAYSTYENNVRERESDEGAIGVAYVCLDDESSCEDCPAFDTNGEYVSMGSVTDIGSGACGCITTPSSRVITRRGWLPIIAIIPGDEVWTHRGRWRRVLSTTMKMSLPLCHEFASVSAPTGAEIGFTADHRLLSPDGWQSIKDIEHAQLSVYHWQHEDLRMWGSAEEQLERLPMPPMCNEMPLWKTEGSSRDRMPFMWNSIGIQIATATERWQDGALVLGRGSEVPSRKAPRPAKIDTGKGRLSENPVPDLLDCDSEETAFSYQTPKILLAGTQQAKVPLWDLEVADDHSFIVEGVVAHNSRCRCYYAFEYMGVSSLEIDREIYA